jgi:hypothetical protein
MNLGGSDGFEIETSMNIQAFRARLTVREVASQEFRRLNGKSKLRTIPDGWRVLKTIIRLGSSKRPMVSSLSSDECRQTPLRTVANGQRGDALYAPSVPVD